MQSTTSIEIDRNIEWVFQRTNQNASDWSLVVVKEIPVDSGPPRVGMRSTITTEDHGKRMQFASTVTEYTPPHRSSIQMQGYHFEITAAYDFEAIAADRTRVTQHSRVQGKGWVRLLFTLFGWMLRKASCDAAKKEMQSLKQFCERESTL